jgi:hypothetical protein
MTPERHHMIEEAVKASPPAAVAGMTIFGVSLPDWAALLACIYTAWLIGEKVYHAIQKRRLQKRRTSDLE